VYLEIVFSLLFVRQAGCDVGSNDFIQTVVTINGMIYV
jgi:hypothetical protein